MVAPMTVARINAQRPTKSDRRAPLITRAQTSRPALSVPSQCSEDTPSKMRARLFSLNVASGL